MDFSRELEIDKGIESSSSMILLVYLIIPREKSEIKKETFILFIYFLVIIKFLLQ